MNKDIFSGKTSLRVRALFLGGRLDLKGLESGRLLPALPLLINAGEQGCAVLFRYGAVVLFNLTPVEELSFLTHLRPLLRDPFETPDTEMVELAIDSTTDERVENNVISIKDARLERLQVVADILAKSVVLDLSLIHI